MAIVSGCFAAAFLAIGALRLFRVSEDQRRRFRRSGVLLVGWMGLSVAHLFAQGR